jgi:uncharacterized membrane protein YedE/YeeE
MIASLATLVVGVLIGYLGQRSNFCTVSGVRDFFLVKNTYRLRGLIGIIIGGVIGYTAFKLMGGDVPNFPSGMDIPSTGALIASIIGGLGLGFWSVLSEGCPFRQHVMAAEGREGAMFYLLGFYLGIIYFFMFTVKWLELLLQIMS